MKLEIILWGLFLIRFLCPLTVHTSNIPIPVIQNYSPCKECLIRVLQHSNAQQVRLVCASNTTHRPIYALTVSRIPGYHGWLSTVRYKESMLTNEISVSSPLKQSGSFGYLSAGNKFALRKKIILVLPSRVARNFKGLDIFFRHIW